EYRHAEPLAATVPSEGHEPAPALPAIVGASAARCISQIPFQGPIGAVRVGRFDGQLVVNPSVSKMEESSLDLVVAGTRDAIIMVEAGAREVPEESVVQALELAQQEIMRICDAIDAFAREVGVPKVQVGPPPGDPEVEAAVDRVLAARLAQARYHPSKPLRGSAL